MLEQVDCAKNMARFYVLSTEPTLFEDLALARRWGRQLLSPAHMRQSEELRQDPLAIIGNGRTSIANRPFCETFVDGKTDQGLVADEREGSAVKFEAKVVSHGRYVAFQLAEVSIARNLFADVLRLIAELRPPPLASTA